MHKLVIAAALVGGGLWWLSSRASTQTPAVAQASALGNQAVNDVAPSWPNGAIASLPAVGTDPTSLAARAAVRAAAAGLPAARSVVAQTAPPKVIPPR